MDAPWKLISGYAIEAETQTVWRFCRFIQRAAQRWTIVDKTSPGQRQIRRPSEALFRSWTKSGQRRSGERPSASPFPRLGQIGKRTKGWPSDCQTRGQERCSGLSQPFFRIRENLESKLGKRVFWGGKTKDIQKHETTRIRRTKSPGLQSDFHSFLPSGRNEVTFRAGTAVLATKVDCLRPNSSKIRETHGPGYGWKES